MPALAFPPSSWSFDHCIAWLENQVAADVSDADVSALFHPDYLEASLVKAWNPNQARAANGRWMTGGDAGTTVGQAHADAHGITGSHAIVVKSKRVTKYAGHATVESYVASHPRGRAHALRQMAADHKAGRIGFEAPKAKGRLEELRAKAAPAEGPRMKTRVPTLLRRG